MGRQWQWQWLLDERKAANRVLVERRWNWKASSCICERTRTRGANETRRRTRAEQSADRSLESDQSSDRRSIGGARAGAAVCLQRGYFFLTVGETDERIAGVGAEDGACIGDFFGGSASGLSRLFARTGVELPVPLPVPVPVPVPVPAAVPLPLPLLLAASCARDLEPLERIVLVLLLCDALPALWFAPVSPFLRIHIIFLNSCSAHTRSNDMRSDQIRALRSSLRLHFITIRDRTQRVAVALRKCTRTRRVSRVRSVCSRRMSVCVRGQ